MQLKTEWGYSTPLTKNSTPKKKRKTNKRYQDESSEDSIKEMNFSNLNIFCQQNAIEN